MPDVEHTGPPDALLVAAEISSAVALTVGEAPRGLVRAGMLLGRPRLTPDGNRDTHPIEIGIEPDLARQIGTWLVEAADAADADLETYLATGNPRE